MKPPRLLLCLATLVPVLIGAPCSTTEIAAGVAGTALVGGYTPGQEIEQIYYLGSFDPRGQLPPEFYRVTVRGQASIISRMRFGSGWVSASVIDSLNGTLKFDDAAGAFKYTTEKDEATGLHGRNLILFGPEGFREAPDDHRLAIVMGSSPEAFFRAVDQSLGTLSRVQQERLSSGVTTAMMAEYMRLQQQKDTLIGLERKAAALAEPAP